MANIVSDPIAGESNQQYVNWAPRWQKMNDIIEGGPALKHRDLGSYDTSAASGMPNGIYLPVLNPSDISAYNIHRNQRYVKGASFYNATQRTLSGLMGMVFRKPPAVEALDERGEMIKANVDGAGVPLDQQVYATTEAVLDNGRRGLLVDMPRKDDGSEITQADISNGMTPRIVSYDALDIIDWDEALIDGKRKLILVVLRESYVDHKENDPLKRKIKCQDRVLRLVDGGYTQQIYREGDKQEPEIPVKGADGRQLDFIPFVFVGSVDNTPDVDRIPLEAIGDVNITHYRHSADLNDSSHQVSACQPWIADDDYRNRANDPKTKGVVELGSETMIIMGSNGSMGFAQPDPNTLANDLMKTCDEQMQQLGAQIITGSGPAETAEAVKMRLAGEVSVLAVVVSNVSAAYTQCLNWALETFLGLSPLEGQYKLNTEFFEVTITPDEARMIMESIMNGYVPSRILLERMQKANLIEADEDLGVLANQAEGDGAVNTGLDS